MTRILKVRLSPKARAKALIDLGDTIKASTSTSIPCEISGLPIYSVDLRLEADLEALRAGQVSHARRVGWRYFAVFDSSTNRPPALLDYAKKTSGDHELWKLDHCGSHFVEALRSACLEALNTGDDLRFAPRLLLLPELRWSAVWMAEKNSSNDLISVENGKFMTSAECASQILALFEKQPRPELN